jgi:uncharacterized protein YecE (DUF72 family)
MAPKRGFSRIGTSGYQYDHWRGIFYPLELRKREWFRFYAGHFDTVEINNTFYNLPQAATFEAWRDQTPPGFLYALKYSRYATHYAKLTKPQEALALFLDRAGRLKPFLGPILVQLPPKWRVNASRLDEFLAEAPPERRWAVEFREPSWLCDPVFKVLQKHRAALCIHDLIPNHPPVQTADWVYVRYHGDRHHAGNYPDEFLAEEARWILGLLEDGSDVYAYFNNDVHGHALRNAASLRHFLS